MRVSLLGNNYPPEFRGGTERVMQALAMELRGLGEDVLVICGSEDNTGGQEIIETSHDGIPVFRIPLAEGEVYGVNVPRPRVRDHVQSLLQKHRVDVAHVHHWSHLSDGMLQMANAIGVAGLCTLHDMWTSCPRFFRQPPVASGITCPNDTEREPCVGCVNLDYGADASLLRDQLQDRDTNILRELGAAAAVTTPSESCAEATRRHVAFAGPIEVIPHGLLQNVTLQPAPEPEPRSPFRVGTFGNVGPEKGVSDLLEAMAGVDGAELLVCGHSPDADYPARLAARAKRLGVTLHLHGPYDEDSHPADQLDLAVFFSRCQETYGLVVEEALARGKPVLVSDRGALPERVRGGGGWIVPHGDIAALRRHIQRLAHDPQVYRQLRSEIPATFATLEDAASRYRDLYAAALARR
ncbi:MAG: glycosyltransferase [Planctomycetota bacterium]|jgi:glycosyltransferase involved in cell wall biosynthesis